MEETATLRILDTGATKQPKLCYYVQALRQTWIRHYQSKHDLHWPSLLTSSVLIR